MHAVVVSLSFFWCSPLRLQSTTEETQVGAGEGRLIWRESRSASVSVSGSENSVGLNTAHRSEMSASRIASAMQFSSMDALVSPFGARRKDLLVGNGGGVGGFVTS
jgi:hypothetical protein